MKKLVLVLVLLVSVLVSYSASTDYVIVRDGSGTTIYSLYNGNSYTAVSSIKSDKLSLSDLESFGLPSKYWPEASGSSGIFDSRLVDAESRYVDIATILIDRDVQLQNALSSVANWCLTCGLLTFLLVVSLAAHYIRSK